jgi:hypothetical protein
MATDDGATGRTTGGNAPITRPAFRITQGQIQPAGVGGGGGHPLLDLTSVSGWRLVAVVAALFYIGVFHLSVGRGGISGGVKL